MLGLNGDDMDPRWPISQVTTGLPFTIVPLRSADALRRAQVASSAYERWIDTVWAKGILAFHLSGRTQEQDITARVFVPYLGVPEDPATGSANGCLAGYILRHNVLGAADIDVRVGQGYEIARPSEILIRASLSENTYRIEVGGRVIDVASGLLNVTA